MEDSRGCNGNLLAAVADLPRATDLPTRCLARPTAETFALRTGGVVLNPRLRLGDFPVPRNIVDHRVVFVPDIRGGHPAAVVIAGVVIVVVDDRPADQGGGRASDVLVPVTQGL